MKSLRGFSLIEVMVSIFIVGVMLILLGAVVRSSVLVRISKFQGVALTIARNKLETLRTAGYVSILSSGSFSDGLMSTLPAGATTTLTVSDYDPKTKLVSVSVIWRDPGTTASTTVSLSTLITKVGGLP